MSGRVKLLVDDEPINDSDTPAWEENYYELETDEFDLACGTFGLSENVSSPMRTARHSLCVTPTRVESPLFRLALTP